MSAVVSVAAVVLYAFVGGYLWERLERWESSQPEPLTHKPFICNLDFDGLAGFGCDCPRRWLRWRLVALVWPALVIGYGPFMLIAQPWRAGRVASRTSERRGA